MTRHGSPVVPSPFPGMDPFLESSEWESFHSAFMIDVSRVLGSRLLAEYVVRAEKRIYVDHGATESPFVADGVVEHEGGDRGAVAVAETSTGTSVQLVMPEEHRETYLEVRIAETREVVTIIELSSPTNKRSGEGLQSYRRKLDDVFRSGCHFVEIDLLRGGRRCSTRDDDAPYRVLVRRWRDRPRAESHRWGLRDAFPTVGIPLRHPHPDGPLDLQSAFDTCFDAGRYGRTLNYDAPLAPPVSDDDAGWIAERLAARRPT